MKKRFLSMIMVISMIIVLVPFQGSATETKGIVDAYISVLKKYDSSKSQYTLRGNNGIAELIVVSEYGLSVYTYKDSKAVHLETIEHKTNPTDAYRKIFSSIANNRLFWTNDYTLLYDVLLDIKVILDGRELSFNQPPLILNDRTFVPLRAIFEAMGATVAWEQSTQIVTGTLDNTVIRFEIGDNYLYKNYDAIYIDAPALLINGYTMVPVRAIAESFGAKVEWNESMRSVYIDTKNTLNIDDENTFTLNTIPKVKCDGYDANFVDFNGMYIDSFTYKNAFNGRKNVKFDVYNTQYFYGIVEVYDENNKLKDVAIIDKMADSASMKEVLGDDIGKLIRDMRDGTVLTYRQESGYSKRTTINVYVPKNGYIKITNDMSESLVGSIINMSDTIFAAKNTFSTLKGYNNEKSKEFVSELSLKLIKETAFAEIAKNQTEYTKKLWKGVGKKLYMTPESVGGFLETFSKNLDDFAMDGFKELVLSTASECGFGVAEKTFESLAGPAGEGLKAIFAFISVSNVLLEMNDSIECLEKGSIKIKTK